ncbi:MlaD family protein [Nocardia sp. NBC_01377]|uniref:MlaD family protein n=1 Tax=Nocardia sp. NBC_01377 TaxID=2903595 RepID=UPI0032462F7C
MTKRILEVPARAVVAVVGALRRHKTATSSIGLLLILAIGVWHLMIGALDIDPLATHYRVRVELARSGGLLPGQDVTLHGVKVGTVESVEVNDHRVIAVAAIDTETRIPASGHARAASLSAAGEQYLDFTADTDSGPFLADGAIIGSDRTSTPVPLSDMLESLSGTLVQIDPTTLRAIVDELGVSETGPEKLAAIIDGGTFLIASLDGVLPQTVRLLRNSKVVLTTLADSEAGMRETAADLAATMGGVSSMADGFTDLVDHTPDLLATVDAVIAQNSPTMVQLLGNLATVAPMAYLRVPAFEEFFFPKQRAGSTLDAMTTAFHDGRVWALASVYPRYQCDYNVPRRPGTSADYPEPYLYADCTDPDPTILPRGARNAPRPPGWNPSVLPPGADPHRTADPSPVGALSILTPLGGGHVPSYVPSR